MKSLPLLSAAALVGAPAGAWALGLGNIELQSALNEPFRAQIMLTDAKPGEVQSLKVALAGPDVFKRYGLTRPADLSALTFSVTRTAAGQDVILVTSKKRIDDPFLTMLVEVTWPAGRLLREYTVLLDPPVLVSGAPEAQPAPRSVAPAQPSGSTTAAIPRQPAAPPVSATPATASVPAAQAAAPVVAKSTPAAEPAVADTFGPVQRGDTLWGIARSVRPADVTTNQMMLAIYKANPQAFQKNINLLDRGATLNIPDRAALLARDPAAATREVKRQVALWKGRVQVAATTGTPAVAPSASTAAPTARLQLVPPKAEASAALGQGDSGTAGANAGAAGAAAAAQVAGLRQQVTSLRTELQEKQRLLQLKNDQLAQLQERLTKAGAAAAQVASNPSRTAPGVALESEATAPAAATVPATDTTTTAPAQPPVASTNTPENNVAAPEAAAPVATSEVATTAPAKAAPQTPSAPEPSLLARLLAWVAKPFVLIGLGIAAVIIISIAYLRRRREDEPNPADGWDALEAEIEEETRTSTSRFARSDTSGLVVEETTGANPMLAPVAGSAAIDKAEEQESSGAFAGLDQADPLAEADFHMAYGLYDQAAELITNALEAEPERRDLRLKLLEVYFVWGNRDAFLDAAGTYHAEFADEDVADWNKVLIMGKQICPDEPLFSEAVDAGAVDLDLQDGGAVDFALGAAASAVDFDFGEDASSAGLELAETGEMLTSEPAEEEFEPAIDAPGPVEPEPEYSGLDSLVDESGSLEIGVQTAASLEEALFNDDDDDERADASRVAASADDDSLAATQESSTMTGARDDDTDWATLLDEAVAGSDDAVTGNYHAPVAADDLDTASTGRYAPLDEDALDGSGATVETPTVESPYMGYGASQDGYAPTVAVETLELEDGAAMWTPEDADGIDPGDLGLSLDDIENDADYPYAGFAADEHADDEELTVFADRVAADDGATEVVPEFGATAFATTAFADTDFAPPASDAADATAAEAPSEEEALEEVDPKETAVLLQDADWLRTALPDDAEGEMYAVVEGNGDDEQEAGHEHLDFDGLEANDEIDLDFDELTRALEGGDTVEQPRLLVVDNAEVNVPSTEDDFASEAWADDSLGGAEDDTGVGPLAPVAIGEIGTKIDLARAYIDMGDQMGARSILEEVLTEGDMGQRDEAQGLIDALRA